MSRLLSLLACLAAAFVLFYFATSTPAPTPVTAPGGAFSAQRAMSDIAAIAPAPHPVGSPANLLVRDYLLARMTALGLSPRVQRAESHRTETFGGETYVEGATVENVIGVLPGRDRSAPALMLMAHRDSVPGSPGAADDAAGVASVLEIARSIETAGTPRRDIVVAITDGEESGLLGANAFFADDPLAAHVGFVINLEARGGGGRAAMFETGADNGATIDLFARTARRPSSTSLSVFIYKLLPNDTDFTIAKAKGLPGLNYAFIGRQFDYHSPSSTVAALDRGAVQHMGDEVLGTARALAMAPALPARAPDKVYADVLGLGVIAYPAWGGWVALAIAAGLILIGAIRAGRAGELKASDIGRGVLASLLTLVIAAIALSATRHLTGAGFGFMAQRTLLARFPLFEAAMAISGLGAILISAAAVAGRRARLAGVWSGLLATALVFGLALQASAPTIAFLIAWPLISAGLLSALTAAGARRGRGWAPGVMILIVTTAWLGVLMHMIMQGLDLPEAPALILWLMALSLWPLAWSNSFGAERFAAGAAAIAAGLGLAVYQWATPPWTAARPEAAEPIYVADPQSGLAWRADQTEPGAWSRHWLTAGHARLQRLPLPGQEHPIAAVPATLAPLPSPTITVTRAGDGTMVMTAVPVAGTSSLRVDVEADAPMTDVRVDGRPAQLAARGRWTHIVWEATPEGFTLSFRPKDRGKLHLRWAQYTPGWPAAVGSPPLTPRTTMAVGLAPASVVVGAETVSM